jgi:2,3-bisphosphoglycerate-independent phosphoglycerate mutase
VERITRTTAGASSTRATLVGLDATLGVAGTPQSGTGQATLLTGADAVALHGRHFGPWVPSRLQPLVREESILRQAQRAGLVAAFANPYPEEVLDLTHPSRLPSDAPGRRRRGTPSFLRAGPPLAALGAGLLTRHTQALVDGDAVATEITNDGWRRRLLRANVPEVTASQAGRTLARIAGAHHVTLFAHYATDYAGHTGAMDDCVLALERVDAFLGGLLDAMPEDLLVFVVSDHGNIEDVRAGHTRNPALGIVIGKGHAAAAARMGSLVDVAGTLMSAARGA